MCVYTVLCDVHQLLHVERISSLSFENPELEIRSSMFNLPASCIAHLCLRNAKLLAM